MLADSVMHQSGREFKCSEPRHIKLPPSCGPSLSRLTEALMVHVMSFLDTFVPFDYSAAMNPKAAPRRRGAGGGAGDGEDAEAAAGGAGGGEGTDVHGGSGVGSGADLVDDGGMELSGGAGASASGGASGGVVSAFVADGGGGSEDDGDGGASRCVWC